MCQLGVVFLFHKYKKHLWTYYYFWGAHNEKIPFTLVWWDEWRYANVPVSAFQCVSVFVFWETLSPLTTRGTAAAVSWLLSVHCLQEEEASTDQASVPLCSTKSEHMIGQRWTDEWETGRKKLVCVLQKPQRGRGGTTVSRWEWQSKGKKCWVCWERESQ